MCFNIKFVLSAVLNGNYFKNRYVGSIVLLGLYLPSACNLDILPLLCTFLMICSAQRSCQYSGLSVAISLVMH